MKTQSSIKSALVLALLAAACVDHRPVRNGLRSEAVYLTKSEMTQPNPKLGAGGTDDGWLFKVTAVKASSPNVLGNYVWPGFESDLKYIKFRFAEHKLQVLDGRRIQADDPADPNDDLAGTTERVMLEFAGENVDVKLRENLDGERTNFLEENTEEPWQKRQKFRVDFESSSLDPVAQIAWYYGDLVQECANIMSTNLVADSFEWDPADQYMSFVLEVNYDVRIDSYYGDCWDLTSHMFNAGTTTIQYRLSFYRPGPSDYVPQVIAEKDPVNKKYGSFQVLNVFMDPDSGLLGAQSLLQRWNPNRADPVVFYFAEGFPPKFKPMFETIKAETNRVLEEAGASLRIDFRDHDWDGVDRKLGDLRYSFATWHQDIETTRGLLGYGPSSPDPRTGEIISANLNLYNVGMDYYRFLVEDYLEKFGAMQKPDPALEWEQIGCSPGSTLTLDSSARLNATLFSEMRRVMELPEPDETTSARDIFVPTPVRDEEEFLDDMNRLAGELRYGEPLYNAYVWRSARRLPIAQLRERLKVEHEFRAAMDDLLLNENPFGAISLYTPAGIEAQNAFLEDLRTWRKNHALLDADLRFALGLENIYTVEDSDAFEALANNARRCTAEGFWESDEQYRDRMVEDIVYHVAIHEFGHNLSLRHNFYGSYDAKHIRDGELSASVMDYVASYYEAGASRSWGVYDENALKWIYGTEEARQAVMADDTLYCTDEHADRSPLCRRHDLGVTPAQIVLNAIEAYDWQYDIRNRRAFRTFWDTSDYMGRVYNGVFPLLRMWYLAIFDWGGGGVQETLKRLDQVDANRTVLTEQQYEELAMDFYNDIRAANGMIMGFYDAVINQSSSFRNYQTEFDPFYGDILRVGIIIDKLFTMLAFMDLQDVYDYDPNFETYVAMYDAPFGTKNAALAQRVLDNMLGANYDIFPWFRYFAIDIFGYVTNSNLIYTTQLRERIAIRRFERLADFEAEFGTDSLAEATRVDNPAQTFVHEGEEYVYTRLEDRGWHLVANRSRSPVSYQYMRDYNQSLNAEASEDLDNYGLKVLLAYYEYYNNFSGY